MDTSLLRTWCTMYAKVMKNAQGYCLAHDIAMNIKLLISRDVILLRCLHKANIDERIEKTLINESWILITFSHKETHGILIRDWKTWLYCNYPKIKSTFSLADHYLGMWVTLILSVLNKMCCVVFGCCTVSHTPYHYQLSHII